MGLILHAAEVLACVVFGIVVAALTLFGASLLHARWTRRQARRR